jgi:hypothetical protein
MILPGKFSRSQKELPPYVGMRSNTNNTTLLRSIVAHNTDKHMNKSASMSPSLFTTAAQTQTTTSRTEPRPTRHDPTDPNQHPDDEELFRLAGTITQPRNFRAGESHLAANRWQ